jgi:hypothetical protein
MEREMAFQSNEVNIPTAILEIRSLDLSLAGQIKLMQFSHEAIRNADAYMAKSPQKKEPFKYFFAICHKWHQERNMNIATGIVDSMMTKYGVSPSEPELMSNGKSAYSKLHGESFSVIRKEEPRTKFNRACENEDTPEEYSKMQKMHVRLRPQEYEEAIDGSLVRKSPKRSLEEELALPFEERQVLIRKMEADWEIANGYAFRRLVGDSTALKLYARLVMQLQTGLLWPEELLTPEKQPQTT